MKIMTEKVARESYWLLFLTLSLSCHCPIAGQRWRDRNRDRCPRARRPDYQPPGCHWDSGRDRNGCYGYKLHCKPGIDVRCLEPPERGTCEKRQRYYYYDYPSRRCRPFLYSGCGGNRNHFHSLEKCMQRCERTSPSREGGCRRLKCAWFEVCDSARQRCVRDACNGHCTKGSERCDQETGLCIITGGITTATTRPSVRTIRPPTVDHCARVICPAGYNCKEEGRFGKCVPNGNQSGGRCKNVQCFADWACDETDGRCKLKSCPVNMVYSSCGTECPESCIPKPCVNTACQEGCFCKPGYVLSQQGVCIRRQNCPSIVFTTTASTSTTNWWATTPTLVPTTSSTTVFVPTTTTYRSTTSRRTLPPVTVEGECESHKDCPICQSCTFNLCGFDPFQCFGKGLG